ncbi:transposase [Chryseobacterium taklimakanense]|nr:transposase [Chryseobacterium taklimakanense]
MDPVVFFKILLVGYRNNLSSDRELNRHCSNALNLRPGRLPVHRL